MNLQCIRSRVRVANIMTRSRSWLRLSLDARNLLLLVNVSKALQTNNPFIRRVPGLLHMRYFARDVKDSTYMKCRRVRLELYFHVKAEEIVFCHLAQTCLVLIYLYVELT
jgi:hypothetical protein